MIRIGVADSHPENACSYYRGLGPLMKIKDLSIQSLNLKSLSWISLNNIDIIYIGRPDNKEFLTLIELAKSMNLPVWIDWDDNILDLPVYNPAYKHYESNKDVTVKCIQDADIITVATQSIKDAFSIYNDNIQVIPNAWNDFNYPLIKKHNENKSILWRGSDTHRGDLLSVLDSMQSVSKTFPEWMFFFMGCNVWYITDFLENSHNIDGMLLLHYFKLLKESKASIFQVPLVDNDFNRSKSNISWLEATYSGAVCIATALPEFDKPGCVTYDNSEKYKYYLEKLINSAEYRQKKYKESFEYIQESLLLSNVNDHRKAIIEGLI